MEKIVITEEEKVALADYVLSQEKMKLNVIDHFIENKKRDNRPFVSLYKPLNRFTPEQFALLLCDWYEVEQPFKVGDWVYNKLVKGYRKIVIETLTNDKEVNLEYVLKFTERYEKVIEPWKIMLLELGRAKPEFKIGDRYVVNCGHNYTITDDTQLKYAYEKASKIKYFYPVESRIEVKGYDSN